MVEEVDGVDFVVVNICGFIESVRKELFLVIDEMIEFKKCGKMCGVIVFGCFVEC